MILGSKCCCKTECLPCTAKLCSDLEYDYALLICNSNSSRDDEWNLKLNGVDLGDVQELGINRCQGKIFYTNIDLLNYIKGDLANPNSLNRKFGRYCGTVPECCLINTFQYTEAKEVTSNAFSYCGTTDLIMKRLKNNFNNNYGNVFIWRRKFYFDIYGSKRYGQLCILTNTIYSASNGPVGEEIKIPVSQPVLEE